MSSERGPSAELRARVLAAVASEPSPRAPRRAIPVALAAGAVALFALTSRAHPGEHPVAVVLGTSVVSAALAFVLTRAARGGLPSDRPSMLGPSDRRATLVVVAASAVLALVALLAARAAPELAAEESASLPCGAHLACGGLLVLQGVLPLLALVWPLRGTDPRRPALTGAALGASAGAWAAMLAWLRCPHVAVEHGLLAHAAPVLVLAALGAALGARMLRLR